MRQIANNTFNGGILMDLNPLTTPNTVLTDVLNGTIITYDGNEFVLQSDDGNGVVLGCMLPKDFIPVGIKEYGGIIYIVSKNPFTQECEIGSFPAPEKFALYNNEDEYTSYITTDLIKNTEGLKTFSYQLDFGDLNTMLRSGDKFCVYLMEKLSESNPDPTKENPILIDGTRNRLQDLVEKYKDGELEERNLFKLKLLRTTDSGTTEDISMLVPEFKDKGIFWIDYSTFSKASANNNIDGYLSTYINKLNGYLTILFELEQIDEFDVNLNTSINTTDNEESYDLNIELNAKADKKCKNNMAGAKIKLNDLDKEVFIEESNGYSENNNIKIIEKNTATAKTINVPNESVSLTYKREGLKKDTDYTIEIIPFSKFNYFENLKYTNIINYSKLNTEQSSNTWKYYFDKSTDVDVESDKLKITFDFIVRGTLNGRNKLDCLYLQFYDVENKVNLYYQVSSIADNKTITLNCYPKDKKSYINNLGNCYLLIDKSKTIDYNEYLKGNTDSLTIKNNNKLNIPYYYEVDDYIKMNDNNNIRINNDFFLYSDHFYIVALVGLDFYPVTKDGTIAIEHKTYISYNYLYTNGVFNKYWINNSEITNYNSLEFPNFYNVKFESLNDWEDNLINGERSVEYTDEFNYNKSYQNYNIPIRIPTELHGTEEFKTRLNVNGNISKTYNLSFVENKDSLPAEMSVVETISNIDVIPYKEEYTALNENEFKIEENNQDSLNTNSNTNGYKLYSGDKKNVTVENLKNGISIDLQLSSNRYVESNSLSETIDYLGIIKKTFKEKYGEVNPIKDSMICVGTDTNGDNGEIFIRKLEQYSIDWDTVYPEDNSYSFAYGKKTRKVYHYYNSELVQRLNSYNLKGVIPFKFLTIGRSGESKFGGVVAINKQNNIVPQLDFFNNGTNIKNINPLKMPGNGRTDINNKFGFLVPTKESGTFENFILCPITYKADNHEEFRNIISKINEHIKNNMYVKDLEEKKDYKIIHPEINNINKNSDFDTTYTFDINLGTISLSSIEVQIGEEKISNIIDNVKTKVSSIFSDKNIEDISTNFKHNTLFDKTQIKCLPYLTSVNDISLNVADDFTITSNRFLLIKDNSAYTIGSIVTELLNYSNYIQNKSETLPDTEKVKIFTSNNLNADDYSGFNYNIDNDFIYYTGLTTSNLIGCLGNDTQVNNNFRYVYFIAGESEEVGRTMIGLSSKLILSSNSSILTIEDSKDNTPIFNGSYGYPLDNMVPNT